jgi:hypothetical protein
LIWVAGGANFAGAGADDVIQPTVRLAVGLVKHCANDLPASRRVGAAVPMPLEHDGGTIVGLDDGAEVRPERADRAVPLGKVRPAEPPGYGTFAASLGEEEQLLPATVKGDGPAFGIGEADAIQRLKPHQLLLENTHPSVLAQQGSAQDNRRGDGQCHDDLQPAAPGTREPDDTAPGR